MCPPLPPPDIFDGLITPVATYDPSCSLSIKDLEKIVDKALLAGSVITCGDRWTSGEWQRPPRSDLVAEVEARIAADRVAIDAMDEGEALEGAPQALGGGAEELRQRQLPLAPLTKKQKKLALAIVKAAKRAQRMLASGRGTIGQGILTLRRMG